MRTIENFKDIDRVLKEIGQAATNAINKNKKLTIEWRDNGITKKQFNALHVWIRHCVNYLNGIKMYRLSPVSGNRIPWSENAFKDDVYKVVLKALSNKKSTKDQNTVEPDEIRLAISGHMATAYKENILLPEWPSY